MKNYCTPATNTEPNNDIREPTIMSITTEINKCYRKK